VRCVLQLAFASELSGLRTTLAALPGEAALAAPATAAVTHVATMLGQHTSALASLEQRMGATQDGVRDMAQLLGCAPQGSGDRSGAPGVGPRAASGLLACVSAGVRIAVEEGVCANGAQLADLSRLVEHLVGLTQGLAAQLAAIPGALAQPAAHMPVAHVRLPSAPVPSQTPWRAPSIAADAAAVAHAAAPAAVGAAAVAAGPPVALARGPAKASAAVPATGSVPQDRAQPHSHAPPGASQAAAVVTAPTDARCVPRRAAVCSGPGIGPQRPPSPGWGVRSVSPPGHRCQAGVVVELDANAAPTPVPRPARGAAGAAAAALSPGPTPTPHPGAAAAAAWGMHGFVGTTHTGLHVYLAPLAPSSPPRQLEPTSPARPGAQADAIATTGPVREAAPMHRPSAVLHRKATLHRKASAALHKRTAQSVSHKRRVDAPTGSRGRPGSARKAPAGAPASAAAAHGRTTRAGAGASAMRGVKRAWGQELAGKVRPVEGSGRHDDDDDDDGNEEEGAGKKEQEDQYEEEGEPDDKGTEADDDDDDDDDDDSADADYKEVCRTTRRAPASARAAASPGAHAGPCAGSAWDTDPWSTEAPAVGQARQAPHDVKRLRQTPPQSTRPDAFAQAPPALQRRPMAGPPPMPTGCRVTGPRAKAPPAHTTAAPAAAAPGGAGGAPAASLHDLDGDAWTWQASQSPPPTRKEAAPAVAPWWVAPAAPAAPGAPLPAYACAHGTTPAQSRGSGDWRPAAPGQAATRPPVAPRPGVPHDSTAYSARPTALQYSARLPPAPRGPAGGAAVSYGAVPQRVGATTHAAGGPLRLQHPHPQARARTQPMDSPSW
jgi:hypothetical protein